MKLEGRVGQDWCAVSVEAKRPGTNLGHPLLSLEELPVTTKESVDEFDTGAFAQGRLLFGAGLEHGRLAVLEESAELVHDTLTTIEEVLDGGLLLLAANLTHDPLAAVHLLGKLKQEEPKLTCHLSEGLTGADAVDCPVVDPLA